MTDLRDACSQRQNQPDRSQPTTHLVHWTKLSLKRQRGCYNVADMALTQHPLFLSVLSAIAVSVVSLIGVATLPLRGKGLNHITFVLISLATGALFGDAVFHLLPDVFKDHATRSSFWVMAGIFASFVFEKFLRWKQDHGLGHNHTHSHPAIKPVGRIILVSDGLHNFMDGLLIGASYLAGIQVGLATTLAVVLHELPHELGDFAILIDAGYSWSQSILFNFLSACAAIVGVLAAFAFHSGMQYLKYLYITIK
jgi:zinc and cadmium transporter